MEIGSLASGEVKAMLEGLNHLEDPREYPVDEDFLRYLATNNWNGISTSDLVCELQHVRALVDEIGLENINPQRLLFLSFQMEDIEKELTRRRQMSATGIVTNDVQVIQTIKDKLGGRGLVDIIDWYTDVFFHHDKWTFRCTLHGKDHNPSGVIYPDEMKWWCYGCSKGGDCFDAVVAYGKVSLPEAINLLGKYLGIETLPNTYPSYRYIKNISKSNNNGGRGIRASTNKIRLTLREPYY
jgi:hypothetical protein